MNNQSFDKTQTKEWAKFWQSELGKIYLDRLENTKLLILTEVMNNTNPDVLSNLAGRAAGIELIIQDIKAGIEAGKENKKEVAAEKK